jgi:hypothetical protein
MWTWSIDGGAQLLACGREIHEEVAWEERIRQKSNQN